MDKTITVRLSSSSIRKAIKELSLYKERIDRKLNELCLRLAEMGATNVSLGYARAIYQSGAKDITVTVEKTDGGYSIVASGESVLFVEFGAGARYGYGHPEAGKFGMGPGTYPGSGHWNDPEGWRTPSGVHTYGNPPNPVMYETAKDLREMIQQVAREVFASD